MKDLSTYRITDFVLFSKDTLLEIYEVYNLDWWPWQILWVILALCLLYFSISFSPIRSKISSAILSAAWAWSGSVFLLGQFQSINWTAQYFAYLFFAEAALIFLFGTVFGKLQIGNATGFQRFFGLALFAASAFVPFEFFYGHPMTHVLAFGWGADRTALGTVGLLLCSNAKGLRWTLMIPSLLWCVFVLLMFYGFR